VNSADELSKLAELAQRELRSNEEWVRAKELYLGQSPDRKEATIRHLGQIFALYREGALSESEFNLKKWDILARS
jgi:hypothetical protein